MGKFDGLLLVSDFDNTLVYTEEALRLCVDMPPVSDVNRAAVEHFMAEGGIFSIATGRAKPAFETVVDGIPMNGPTVLFNGAAIYDFRQRKYLVTAFLPDTVREHITQVVTALPEVAAELYHDDNTIHALNANDVTRRHMHVTHSPSIEVDSIEQVPSPISKTLFSTEEEHLDTLLAYLKAQPWYDDYEVVPSAVTLVELTAKEFDVIEFLMRNPNRVYSREALLDTIWAYEYRSDIRTVDVHIRRLREKLEDNPAEPKHILTKWGVGYYFKN